VSVDVETPVTDPLEATIANWPIAHGEVVERNPSEEVDTSEYTPPEVPMSNCPNVGAVDVPVPPPYGKSTVASAKLGNKRAMRISFFMLVVVVSE